MEDRDWELRQGTLGLVDTGHPEVTILFIQALKDKDKLVRPGAARVLGEIGDARAVEPLARSLKDKIRMSGKPRKRLWRRSSQGKARKY